MKRSICLFATLLLSLLSTGSRADENDDLFESQIRPVLVGSCLPCHNETKMSGGLRVDSLEALLQGGNSGPAIVPRNPEESLLIQAIHRQADVYAMPPDEDKALRADQIEAFVSWVNSGSVWPAKTAKLEVAAHWSFKPVRDIEPPVVQDKAWVKNSIDAFIHAKQEAAGVRPAPAADKLMLIRRATFDLTGLPPTPAEVQEFENDSSPQAFEKVVDRLLKSSAYGERWGRHWLDVVRYADTAGETADYPVPLAWRYRNYVIDAFNHDKPYDQFVREQIAGDILAERGPRERYAEQATATGYLAISRRFGFDSENYHHLTIQDTIDTLGQSVLGLSLGCARCHDHKFDALSMRDYYGLYGIFDSSRYAFPGSEQKKQVRAMLPLIPVQESRAQWLEFDARVAAIATSLEKQNQPVPATILRSLNDIDGDFEMQAAAAGGSNGVLVSPWLYSGTIAVTNTAQSPYKNLYPRGKVGVSIPIAAGEYRIAQALCPRRSPDDCDVLYVNLDFRAAASGGDATEPHRFWIGSMPVSPAIEVLISPESLALQIGETIETVGPLRPNEWHNLQLALDLKHRTVSGSVGMPGSITKFSDKPISAGWPGAIDLVVLDSQGGADTKLAAIEYDNFGMYDSPIAPVSTEPPTPAAGANGLDFAAMAEELEELTGFDGDFELQVENRPPAGPWEPGPKSAVKTSHASQSPFRNAFASGELGIHMPNRSDYDGFGRKITDATPNDKGQLWVSFDFRCASMDAGGKGSWRYYIGHGPGNSAAIELFFDGTTFFRSGPEAVAPIVVGKWYQVQLTLDLNAKTYSGLLASHTEQTEFSGKIATNWDGTIDYTFIDSYGHIGGVRPAIDADNFAVSATQLPAFDAESVKVADTDRESRRVRIMALRQQLKSYQPSSELNRLLAEGPCAMTYGMAEGTPHNVRMQLRGEPDQPGDEVPRGFIKVLGGGPLGAETSGSGRLELAQWLTRPDNPLTARVMVNRIWQYHFGRGLVKTPNDFGVRGIPPTHPELLDHLAMQFIRGGWSVKALHRLIMLSATYEQASVTDAAAEQAANGTDTSDLYVGFSRRRLDAEEIRDAILAVSGELDPTPAQEHPFPLPTTWSFSQHGPFSAVYDHNKRSVYLMTQRLKRHPFLALFDGADPNASTAERLDTTVPTQALFFLNDPFVHEKAEKWATRLQAASADETDAIEQAWYRAVGRFPTETERREATEFLAAYRAELIATKTDNVETRALAAYLRTLIGSNEFLHVD